MVAAGESQSAACLVTYINAVDPHTQVFDGYFVHGRPGIGVSIDGVFIPTRDGLGFEETTRMISSSGERIREDARVPVLILQSETDLVILGGHRAAQPDSEHIRVWEMPGAAHADTYTVSAGRHDDGTLTPQRLEELLRPTRNLIMGQTPTPVNAGPQQHYVAQAALSQLVRWASGGPAAASGPRLDLEESGLAYNLDAQGNATGGIRTPWVDAPTTVLSGLGQTGVDFAVLFGRTVPFDDATLAALYPGGKDEYLERFTASLDAAIDAGFLLADDRDEILGSRRRLVPPASSRRNKPPPTWEPGNALLGSSKRGSSFLPGEGDGTGADAVLPRSPEAVREPAGRRRRVLLNRSPRVLRPARPERGGEDDHHLHALWAGPARRGPDHHRRPRGRQPRSEEDRRLRPQDLALYPDLSAAENLTFFGQLYGLSGKDLEARIGETLELVGLADRKKDRIGTYSGGMKRRANMAAGLLHRPKLLVLDEPTVGVDPQSRNAILETVAALGIAVLYTTHYMEEASKLCDRIGIIDDGHLVAEGTAEGLIGQHGGRDKVHLDCAPESLDELAAACRELENVHDVGEVDGHLELTTDHGPAVLPAVVAVASRHRVELTGVEVRSPNLEDVFLRLTGKELRD